MKESTEFNYKKYWINRHRIFYNTMASVGVKSFSDKTNKLFYNLVKEKYNEILEKSNINIVNKEVLDAGAGIGEYIDFFLSHKAKVTAIDISPESINKVKIRFPGIYSLNISLDDIDKHFNKNSFYLVSCFDVLYHITNDNDWRKSINNLMIVSKKFIVLHESFPRKRFKLRPLHVKHRTIFETKLELAKGNYYEIASIPTGVIRRLPFYRFFNIHPYLFYNIDKLLLKQYISNKIGCSFIKIFEKK